MLSATHTKEIATLLKTAAQAIKALAAEKRTVKTASAGPVINLTKLRSLLHVNR